MSRSFALIEVFLNVKVLLAILEKSSLFFEGLLLSQNQSKVEQF